MAHLVHTMQNPSDWEGPKDSSCLETSRDNCVVKRDLKNTANQGTQVYVLKQNTPKIYVAVLKESFRMLDRN